MKTHEYFIEKCIELARQGIKDVSPNPMVGAIVTYNGKIIGEGWHKKYGRNHAEINAINNVQDKSLLKKSTLYVNLEPCCHFGNTPPCTDFIIKKNIPNVIIGCIDPNSEVAGKGIKKLQENSVNVISGVLDKKCRDLNKRFFKFKNDKKPYVILKWAKSRDNFIAPINQNKPFWMTSEQSKKLVHKWRSEEDSILVGTNTVNLDNPSLTVRLSDGKNPIRVIIDRNISLDANYKIFNSDSKTIIFNEKKTYNTKTNYYIKVNFNSLIEEMLKELYKLNIISIIVEGGAYTLSKFIQANIYDEIRVFTTKLNLENGIESPNIPELKKISSKKINSDTLDIYIK